MRSRRLTYISAIALLAALAIPVQLAHAQHPLGLALGIVAITLTGASASAADDDRKAVAALDTAYQAAVKKNDAATMDKILADDFVLVTGSGKTYTRDDFLNEARGGKTKYEQNDESVQTVRVWGDTAVVTAKLWEKGTQDGKPFEHIFWFSDTYVRTPTGWRYIFGQSAYCPCQKTP